MADMVADGRESARSSREIQVWDPLVRVIHWSVAVLVLVNAVIVDDESAAHVWAGYAVLGLVMLRLFWGVIGTRFARFSAFPPSVSAAREHVADLLTGHEKVHLSHNPLGALMVYNLWATLLAICATGLMMESTAFFGVKWVEGAHEIAFNWLMISVGLHVTGVLVDTWLTRIPLVRAMVNGRKAFPTPVDRRQ